MQIIEDGIHLVVSENEADIIRQALIAWRGPYPNDDRPNNGAQAHHTKCLEMAKTMSEAITNELERRFNNGRWEINE